MWAAYFILSCALSPTALCGDGDHHWVNPGGGGEGGGEGAEGASRESMRAAGQAMWRWRWRWLVERKSRLCVHRAARAQALLCANTKGRP